MRGWLTLSIVVVLVVATAASAAPVWWGSSEYKGNGFISLRGPGSISSAMDLSMRFTAKRNVTGIKIVKLRADGGFGGSPAGYASICADDGSGEPGAALGTSPIVAITANTDMSFTLGSAVNLTAGTVYHVRLTGDPNMTSADRVRINHMSNPKAVQYNQHVEGGRLDLDPNMAGLFYLKDHVMYPDGWYEGRPAEWVDYWEPFFGLYDAQDVGLYGEGGRGGYDRLNSNTKGFGHSFILQNVPPAHVSGGQVTIGKLRVRSGKKNSPTSRLILKLLDSANNTLAAGSMPMANVVDGWNDIIIPQTTLTIGQRYSVVAFSDGSGECNGSNWLYERYHSSTIVPVGDLFQGTQSYSLSSTDSGTTWTPDDTKDYLIGIYVPEPATLGLLVLGGLTVLARKRR